MEKHTYFMTGYPGFLATQLIKQLAVDQGEQVEAIYTLVLPQMEGLATREMALLPESVKDKVHLVRGDITKEGLDLDEVTNKKMQKSVTHVFHLAAVYDLAVKQALAKAVNVMGTYYVSEWVQTLPHLERYVYFSTAYVSGRREGPIYEDELEMGQTFKNHYEATKYAAEVIVQQVSSLVPTTIIRPGIVRGHSETGETLKFDGIYFILNHFDHLRYLPAIPYLGAGTPEGNFVPYDYVIRASSYLAHYGPAAGETYHLTDPHPYKMHEIYRMICQAYLGKTPTYTVPLSLVKMGLSSRLIRQFLHVEKEAIDYFTIHSHYDTTNAKRDLQGSGIVCPDLKESLGPMIDFYRKYKDDSAKHILIR